MLAYLPSMKSSNYLQNKRKEGLENELCTNYDVGGDLHYFHCNINVLQSVLRSIKLQDMINYP